MRAGLHNQKQNDPHDLSPVIGDKPIQNSVPERLPFGSAIWDIGKEAGGTDVPICRLALD